MADVNIKIKLQDAGAKKQVQSLITQMQRLQTAANGVTKAFQRTNRVTKETASKISIVGEKAKQAALKTQLMEAKLRKIGEGGKAAGRGLNVSSIALASFVGNITSRIVSSAITNLIGGFKSIVQAGRDFEDGLVAVGKTTGISGRNLNKLGDSITKISRTIPVATKDLLAIATVAGQLGLKSAQDITQFTETIGKLQLATDIAGEEGSQSVARILTITGELEKNGSENINKFGNVITQLGNNFAATESQILSVANEVAKGTSAFGLASEDVLGLATAFKATGSEAETSGSAVQKVFTQIASAVTQGGDDLFKFAKASNLTSEEFKKLFENDPTQAFLALSKGINENSKTGGELADTLKSLGLGSLRVSKALTPLIARYGTLEKAIADARNEAREKTALDEEASKAADTLSGDIQSLSNAFDEFSKQLFKAFGPALRSVVQSLTSFTDLITSLVDRKVLIALAGGVTAVGIALGVLNKGAILLAITSLPALVKSFALLVAEITLATGGLNLIIPAIFSLGAATALYVDSLDDANRAMKQQNLNAIDLADAYEELDEDSQDYLDSLNALTVGLERGNGVNLTYTKSIKGINDNLVELKRSQASIVESNDDLNKSTESRTLFEADKLKKLKKFFKEEEQARLQLKFKTLKDKEEIEAYEKFVQREGERRRADAYASIIGQDKATLAAKRAHQAELKKLANEEKARLEKLRAGEEEYTQFLKDQEISRQEALASAIEERKLAEEEDRLSRRENNKIFTDDRLIALQNYFTKEQEIQIQAKLNAAKTATERETILERVQAQGLRKRRQLEETADRLKLQGAASVAGGLASILQLGGKKNFEAVKAFSIAESTIRGYLQVQQALSQPPGPPITVPYAIGVGVQAAARTAQIAAQKPGFQDGGIVGGSSFTGDKVEARVNSGEMILNREQQKQLFNMANGNASSGNPTQLNITVQSVLDGEIVAESVSNRVANGLVLGEVQ